MKLKSDKLKIKNFKLLVVVFVFSFLIFGLALPAQAISVPGWPIVPCGTSTTFPCTRCDLFKLIKNVVDFITGGLMPPVAVLLFVWAGFLILMGGANPGLVTKGKEIFKNTSVGLIIMLSAWMITNTIIQSVGAKYNNAQNWWQFVCVETPPAVPPVVQRPPGGALCSNPRQLAQQNNVPYPRKNAPELDALVSCVNSRIGTLIDQSQIFTYERSNDLCNYTRGQPICGRCAHTAYSCHYGGRDGTQGSLAVDFNAANGNERALYNELVKLRSTCNFGFIQLEPTHTHISSQSCSGN